MLNQGVLRTNAGTPLQPGEGIWSRRTRGRNKILHHRRAEAQTRPAQVSASSPLCLHLPGNADVHLSGFIIGFSKDHSEEVEVTGENI